MATAELARERLLASRLFFAALGVVCFCSLVVTLKKEPLFPFQMQSLSWTQTWLIMTCASQPVWQCRSSL